MGLPARKLDLLNDPAAVASVLDPARRKLLALLAEQADSATGLSKRLRQPRQKVNYHLRELEKSGLVRLVEERKKGNCTERVVCATATHYLVSPEILGMLGPDAASARDRFSWATLVTSAARAIRDLATLRRRADGVGKNLPTLSLEAEVRFASPAAMNAFAEDLANEVARLVAKHQDDKAPSGRVFRFFLGSYPVITKSEEEHLAEADEAERSRVRGDSGTDA